MTTTLQVILGSTRPGRVGEAVGTWFAELARSNPSFEVEVIDLAELDLPLLNEPNHPMLRQYTQDHTKEWSAIVERGDAYVFVHPEYNFGVNAALKNALDYLVHEWRYKPVGFVSYGGVSGGLRAKEMLKQICSALGLVPVPTGVVVPFVRNRVDEAGHFDADPIMVDAAGLMLDELARLGPALATVREDGQR